MTVVCNDPVNFIDPTGLCIFNINLNASDLTAEQIKTLKTTMRGLFSAAGQTLVFNNAFAARGTTRGSFTLTVGFGYPGNMQTVLDRAGQHSAIGFTPNWGNRGALNILNLRMYYYSAFGNQNAVDPNELAVALGGAGAHESAHHFLQMGHAPDGLMRAGPDGFFVSGLAGRQFTAAQAQQLSNLCLRPIPTSPNTLPFNTIPMRPLIPTGGGAGGFLGGGFGGVAGWSAMRDFMNWMRSIGAHGYLSGYHEISEKEFNSP